MRRNLEAIPLSAPSISRVRVQGYGYSHNLTQPLLRKGEESLWFEIGTFGVLSQLWGLCTLFFACFALFAVNSQKSELLHLEESCKAMLNQGYYASE